MIRGLTHTIRVPAFCRHRGVERSVVTRWLRVNAATLGEAPIKSSLNAGFTLIELMIAVAVVAILTLIALPSYTNSIMSSNRAAGEACLSSYANYMERFYATNLSYSQNTSGVATVLPSMDCASTANTGNNYSYSFVTGTLTSSAYTLQAVPIGNQATKDKMCATLTLDQTGTRNISGTGSVNTCWQH